ncbi:MAG: L,D-transpeptidase [Alphaproteobacteria bacterium]|nr:L,D-transpeptidase [Alphaproteobacteria bacterium]
MVHWNRHRQAAALAAAILTAALGVAEAATRSLPVPPPAGVTVSAKGRPNALTLTTESQLPPSLLRQVVPYATAEKPGTIIVNTGEKHLYLVLGKGLAMRYGIGVARTGFEWSGSHAITAKRTWPDWTPPPEMLERRPDIPTYMEGGLDNPLGARALYIGSTLYRIHGTNEPWTIGGNVSSGCIRLTNEDVKDLYARAKIGAKVIVF